MTTILECLLGAQINLNPPNSTNPFAVAIGRRQLANAITLLKKGYPLSYEMDQLIEKHTNLEDAPDAIP